MRRLTPLLPYIPVLLAAAWLGTRFRVVLGLFLVAHGLVHLMYVVPEPAQSPGGTEWPFHADRSWALSTVGLGTGALQATAVALMALTIAGFTVAGIALLANLGWWTGTAIAAAAASSALLALYLHPLLVLGLAINAFVLSVTVLEWPALGYAA